MQGQAAHFVKFAPEKIESGIKRYTEDTRRLYGVIEKTLSDGRQWLAADEHTIADMAKFSWMFVHQMAGQAPTRSQCIAVHLLHPQKSLIGIYSHLPTTFCGACQIPMAAHAVQCSNVYKS